MPLARIRTVDPASVTDLASELREAGYDFEIARPDEQCALEADVDIRVESMPVQQAFDRAYEMNNGGTAIYVAPGLLEPADAPPARPQANEADIRIEHSSRSSPDYELPEAIPYSQSIDLDAQQGSTRFDYERSSDKRSRLSEGIASMRGMVEGTISNFRERQAERAGRRNAESAARAEQAAALRQKQLEDLASQREEARKRREEYERQQEQERIAHEQRERELALQRERALALQRERDAEEARKALVVQQQREQEQRHREARETQLRMEEARRATEVEKSRAEEQRQQEILDAPRLQQEEKLRQEYERTLAEERQRREQQFAMEREAKTREEARREEERRDKERQEQLQLETSKREEEERRRAPVAALSGGEVSHLEAIPIASLPVRYVTETDGPAPEPARANANAQSIDKIHEAPATFDAPFAVVPLAHPAEREFDNGPASPVKDRSMGDSLFGERPRQRAFQFAAVAAAIIALFAMGIWAAVSGRKPADPLNFGSKGQPNIQQATPFGAATAAPRQVQAANPAPRVAAPAKTVTAARPAGKAPVKTASRKPSSKKRAVVSRHKTKTTTTRTARRSRAGVRQYSDMN